jgi:hypothetical protein
MLTGKPPEGSFPSVVMVELKKWNQDLKGDFDSGKNIDRLSRIDEEGLDAWGPVTCESRRIIVIGIEKVPKNCN